MAQATLPVSALPRGAGLGCGFRQRQQDAAEMAADPQAVPDFRQMSDARQESHHKPGCVKRPAPPRAASSRRGEVPAGLMELLPGQLSSSGCVMWGLRASSLDGQPPPPSQGHPTLRAGPRVSPWVSCKRPTPTLRTPGVRVGQPVTVERGPRLTDQGRHLARSTEQAELAFEIGGGVGPRSMSR